MADPDNIIQYDIDTFNYKECKKKYIKLIKNNPNNVSKYYPYDEKSKNEIILFVKGDVKPYSRKYDIIKDANNVELLILKRRIADIPVVEVLPITQCFDVMAEIHLLEHHASYSKMAEILKTIYCIPLRVMITFIKACNVCGYRRIEDTTKQKVLIKRSSIPIFSVLCTTLRLNSQPDYRFSHVIVYVDTMSNYVLIKPTYSQGDHVVAYELMKIFLDFGIPEYFIVNNGGPFYKRIMKVLSSTEVFSRLPVVLQKNNLDRLDWASKTTAILIKSWIRSWDSYNWAVGLREIQWFLNNLSDYEMLKSIKLQDGIQSPFHALFGFLPNHNVIQTTKALTLTSRSTKLRNKINNITLITFAGNCLNCGTKMYELFYKTCVLCKRKYHFNCCAVNVVGRERNVETTCHPCNTRKINRGKTNENL